MTEGEKKEKSSEKIKSQKPETGDDSSWSEDQKKRSYYYDDACGYEIYNPDEDEDEEDEPISPCPKSY